MFDFKDKVVAVTGGAGGIGKCICEMFERAGAIVCVIDVVENDYYVGNLAEKEALEQEFATDYQKLIEIAQEKEAIEAQLEELMELWEEASS